MFSKVIIANIYPACVGDFPVYNGNFSVVSIVHFKVDKSDPKKWWEKLCTNMRLRKTSMMMMGML